MLKITTHRLGNQTSSTRTSHSKNSTLHAQNIQKHVLYPGIMVEGQLRNQ